MVIKRFLCLCCGLFLLPCMVYANTLTSSIDRNQMHIGESLELTVTLQGSADSDPDFTPLKQQFELVGQNKSSNIQIINSTMRRSTQWQITLMPRKTGMLSIPPIHAGSLVSRRIHLQVLPEDQNTAGLPAADVFLEVTVLPQDVYVQQQVLCTVRLFRAVNLTEAQLSEPDVMHAAVERLGKDASYKIQRQGRSYIVTERRYAIFPQQHGDMIIPAIHFTGKSSRSNGFFMQSGRVLRKSSAAITIHVHAIPLSWPTSSEWLPASHLVLHEEGLDVSSIHVGDALTRNIHLEATGLTAAQLPPLPTARIPDVFRQYPDQPHLHNQQQSQGIVGTREEKTALIATQSGTFTLPAIRIPWWNTSKGRMEIAAIPARVLTVLPAINQTNTPATVLPSKHNTPPLHGRPSPAASTKTNVSTSWISWPTVAAGLAIGWLLTVLMYVYTSYNASRDDKQVSKERYESERLLRKKVLQACRKDDPKIAVSGLIKWAKYIAPMEHINNIPQLAAYLKKQDDRWLDALLQLDRCLYGQTKEPWDGSSVYDLITDWKAVPIDSFENKSLPLLRVG